MAMRTVTLDGPGKNALSTRMMHFILETLDEAGDEPLLFTGAGDSFSAGLDLKELLDLDAAGIERFLQTLEEMVAALFHYPGPTVAAVNGHAIAGGCVVALCCDLRVGVADPRVKIGLNEVALGLRFPPVTLRMVRHRVPERFHREVILGAQLVDAGEAARQGLLDEVSEDCVGRGREWLERLAAHPRDVYAAAKRDLLRGVLDVSEAERRRFVQEVLPVWASDATRSRIARALRR
ncbi:MAG: enoyl-CoA hydratase/isomerase family protein [Deltaproteobacteria bacterium]|nr:MAG: enoyl-CoA hydratase/isomerase family protein [Deltaproteobacteria bacterium]